LVEAIGEIQGDNLALPGLGLDERKTRSREMATVPGASAARRPQCESTARNRRGATHTNAGTESSATRARILNREPSMHSSQQDMHALREQIARGSIRRAYRALISTTMGIRAHFKAGHPSFEVSGLYQGYLDMTYFAVVPPSLKSGGLKIAIVFNYDEFQFEAWLVGRNRKVQREYWELFRDSRWPSYRVVAPATGVDAIVEYVLVSEPDFRDPDALTSLIEAGTLVFIRDMETFLSEHAALEAAGSAA
jgi:hypothetical protein